jgi:peptidoglycan/LPS O-acetylase OafA/YrhL
VANRAAYEPGNSRRLDIQGLRALAVLMVVAFHSGLPVPGGFVGVDVFFVISGFVITMMLRREWEATRRIRFGAFYLRRFKRLTPALALMVGTTAIISSLVLSPLGSQQTAAETGIGAMLLSANQVIGGATGGYFDAPAESNPLLNTWSLSVEEQFYLAFPAILALGWLSARRFRRVKHAPAVIVGLIAAVSFVLADLGSSLSTSSWLLGFYSPLTRAWEFALGALLALVAARLVIRSRMVVLAVGLLGAAMLGASLWLVTEGTPFPGVWTLLPVLGTSLLILVGTHTPNVLSSALATRPLATIGDYSYSVYLWHWPFIVFAALLWPEVSYAPLAAATLSLGPALASFRWVEQPFRKLDGLARPRLAGFAAAVVVAPIVVAGAVGVVATHYWTPRYEAGDIAIVNDGDIGHDDWHRHLRDSFYPCTPKAIRERALRWEGVVRCQQSKPGADVSLAVIGDSHAEHLFLGLAEALPEQNVAYYIRDNALLMSDSDVARIVEHVAASAAVKTVVVSTLWTVRGVRGTELSATLNILSESGKSVFVTDDVPSFPFEPFGCKYRRGLLRPTRCSMDAQRFRRRYSLYYPELLTAVRRVPGARMVKTVRYFCDQTTCDMSRFGRLLFRDRDHLNMHGSRFVAAQMLHDYPALAAVTEHPVEAAPTKLAVSSRSALDLPTGSPGSCSAASCR